MIRDPDKKSQGMIVILEVSTQQKFVVVIGQEPDGVMLSSSIDFW